MTTTHFAEPIPSHALHRDSEPTRDDVWWLPVTVVPSTFVFCVVMFFLLHQR